MYKPQDSSAQRTLKKRNFEVSFVNQVFRHLSINSVFLIMYLPFTVYYNDFIEIRCTNINNNYRDPLGWAIITLPDLDDVTGLFYF